MKNILISLTCVLAVIIVFLYAQGILPTKPYQKASLSTEEVLTAINKTRSQYGLKQLKTNPLLQQAAQAKAIDIFKQQYFQHTSPNNKDFSDFIKETNYQANRLGENLAKNISDPQTLIQSWLDSPPHRDNLLNPYFQEVGLGILAGNLEHKKTTIVVEMLGEPKEKKGDDF